MDEIPEYHLHRDDLSKLHFEINETEPYCDKNTLHCFKPHRHSFYQIIWFKEEGSHYIDYEILNHPRNSIVLINKNQVHHFCPDSKNEGVIFHFNDIFLTQYDFKFSYTLFSGIGSNFFSLNTNQIDRIDTLLTIIQQELAEKKTYFQIQLFLIFHSFILLLEQLKNKSKSGSKHINDPLFYIAVKFKAEIGLHLSESKSLTFYFDKLNVNSKKLTLASKKYLNDTPNNIIRKEKLIESKRLLLNSDLSIQQIAYSLGYDQPTYFTKIFKSHFNTTPKEFRESVF